MKCVAYLLLFIQTVFSFDFYSRNETNNHSNSTPLPQLIITPTSSVLCSGETVTLTVSGTGSYSWNTGATGNNIVVSPTITTTYTVTESDTNNPSSASIQIVVKPLPVIQVNQPTICPGATTTLFATTASENGVTFLWQPGGATTSTLLVSPGTSTSYSLTASHDGCYTTVLSNVTVASTIQPVTNFFYAAPICINHEDIFPNKPPTFNSGGAFTSEPALSISANSGLIDLTTSKPGMYLITYSLAAQNCTASGKSSTVIVIDPGPTLTVSPDKKIGPGASTTLSITGATSYTWNHSSEMSCAFCENPVVTPIQTTRYCVLAEHLGCAAKACVIIEVGCDGGDLSLPNAFSPNGDGFNDDYCLQGWDLCIDKFSILIFNRWGEKVYESNNSSFCWDGNFNGKILESDVYVYTLTALFNKVTRIDKKGNITLLR